MHLDWNVTETATVLYVAAMAAQGRPLVDSRIQAAVAEPAERLRVEIAPLTQLTESFWSTMCGQAGSDKDLAAVVHSAWPFSAPSVTATQMETVIGLLQQVQERIHEVIPQLVGDLHHRQRPLRQQWEARGPGMLGRLYDQIGKSDGADTAADVRILVVHPVLGGSGGVDSSHSAVWIEALLANPLAELPEVVRLGWLLAQLISDRRLEAAASGVDRPLITELALIPAALAAAADVELAVCNSDSVNRAIRFWLPVRCTDELTVQEWSETVWHWWQNRDVERPWGRQLAALSGQIVSKG